MASVASHRRFDFERYRS